MNLISKPNIYYPGTTIDSSEARKLVENGLLRQFSLEDENGKLVNGGHFLMEDIKGISYLTSKSAAQYHYLSSIKENLHTVLGYFKLYPTPQSNNLFSADDPDFISVNRQAIVLGDSTLNSSYTPNLKLKMWNGTGFEPILDVRAIWWDKSIINKMITFDKDLDTSPYEPSLASLRYSSTLGLDNDKTLKLRQQLSKFAAIQPSKISYFLLMPSPYYQSSKGIESLIRNYIRNGASIRDGQQLLQHLKATINLLSTDPTLKAIDNARERVLTVHKYAVDNIVSLDLAIKREHIELQSAHRTFQFLHYESIENTVLMNKTSGLIRYNPHEWVVSTDRSLVNDLKNARHHNLLPEVKSYERNKNRNDKIINSASLVGNCTVSEIPTVYVAKNAPTLTPKPASRFDGKSGFIKGVAPSISFHETFITEPILFKGYFEGVPSMDSKFSSKIIGLMESEYAAKLSGINFKLPMLLIPKAGKYELKRQTGNEPFTHIAKFPMPNFEDITLAEWLSLYLIDRSLVLETAQTTLVAFEGESGLDNIPASVLDEYTSKSSEGIEGLRDQIEEIFNTQVFDKRKIKVEQPPFLLSTRFDIPNANETKKIKSHDFAELLLHSPEEKYSANFEDIGYWITENIEKISERETAHLDVVKQLFCSYILHNNDLHLKNITLLEIEDLGTKEVHKCISPCYDVIITPLVYFNSDLQACYQSALPVNGTKHPSVDDLISCCVTAFGFTHENARMLFQQVCKDIKDSVVSLKMCMPEEIENRPRWSDVVTKGLNIVNRNLRHIEKNDMSYSIAHTEDKFGMSKN